MQNPLSVPLSAAFQEEQRNGARARVRADDRRKWRDIDIPHRHNFANAAGKRLSVLQRIAVPNVNFLLLGMDRRFLHTVGDTP